MRLAEDHHVDQGTCMKYILHEEEIARQVVWGHLEGHDYDIMDI